MLACFHSGVWFSIFVVNRNEEPQMKATQAEGKLNHCLKHRPHCDAFTSYTQIWKKTIPTKKGWIEVGRSLRRTSSIIRCQERTHRNQVSRRNYFAVKFPLHLWAKAVADNKPVQTNVINSNHNTTNALQVPNKPELITRCLETRFESVSLLRAVPGRRKERSLQSDLTKCVIMTRADCGGSKKWWHQTMKKPKKHHTRFRSQPGRWQKGHQLRAICSHTYRSHQHTVPARSRDLWAQCTACKDAMPTTTSQRKTSGKAAPKQKCLNCCV